MIIVFERILRILPLRNAPSLDLADAILGNAHTDHIFHIKLLFPFGRNFLRDITGCSYDLRDGPRGPQEIPDSPRMR